MADSGRQRWLSTAILVGVIYLAVGRASAALAGTAASNQMRSFWRLSTFVISGAVFAVHIANEHFRLRNTARPTAWHASLAVAIGAFGLALWANIHDLGSASGYRPRMLIAFVAWPLLTAVPAFIVALVVALEAAGNLGEQTGAWPNERAKRTGISVPLAVVSGPRSVASGCLWNAKLNRLVARAFPRS